MKEQPGVGVHLDVHVQIGEFALNVQLQYAGSPIVALVGPNGAGKTSLLRTIAGAYRPLRGKVRLGDGIFFEGEGRSAHHLAPEQRGVAYLPQNGGLLPHLSGLKNVVLGLQSRADAVSRQQLEPLAKEALSKAQAQSLSDKYPAKMSGGEVQRVALARLLAMRPKLSLLDEPLAAIDLPSRRAFRRLLKTHLQTTAVPAFIVTHDPRDVLELATDVCVLSGGSVVARGSPEQLCRNPPTDFLREFFAMPEPQRQGS